MMLIRKLVLLILLRTVQCAIEDDNIVTWNMQGATSGGEGNWFNNVRNLLVRHGARIVVLQEAGSIRSVISLTRNQTLVLPTVTNPDNVRAPLTAYRWHVSNRFYPYDAYIYFLETNFGDNRVNLAIVTSQEVDEVILLQPSDHEYGRPTLGIRIDRSYVFTVHAISRGGPDAPAIVNRIFRFFQLTRPFFNSWMITGDFNREPDDLMNGLRRYVQAFIGVRYITQNQATQRSGHILDYAIVPRSAPLSRIALAFIVDYALYQWSDHLAIGYPGRCSRKLNTDATEINNTLLFKYRQYV